MPGSRRVRGGSRACLPRPTERPIVSCTRTASPLLLLATCAAVLLAAVSWSPAASAAPAAPAAPAEAHSLSAAHLTRIRVSALDWAEKQAGKWYCWGCGGPSCYDCSGLVMAAYQHAGISLPHSTYEMLDSGELREIPASERKPGDLAFYGTGHVELVTSSGTFGALDSGSQIGWHYPNQWWYPTMYYEVR
jgi:cell wall-associated NlpC family hydrolase